ncbi:hypothetical protein B0H13DRAFT_1879123 [Mycena leptocephala]|nr:hypothetical protein B0H13DRAFT_1879123 [Mycena leptocephala]
MYNSLVGSLSGSWSHARNRLGLPKPPSVSASGQWSELHYAEFLFGSSACILCREPCVGLPFNFLLRFRLCTDASLGLRDWLPSDCAPNFIPPVIVLANQAEYNQAHQVDVGEPIGDQPRVALFANAQGLDYFLVQQCPTIRRVAYAFERDRVNLDQRSRHRLIVPVSSPVPTPAFTALSFLKTDILREIGYINMSSNSHANVMTKAPKLVMPPSPPVGKTQLPVISRVPNAPECSPLHKIPRWKTSGTTGRPRNY